MRTGSSPPESHDTSLHVTTSSEAVVPVSSLAVPMLPIVPQNRASPYARPTASDTSASDHRYDFNPQRQPHVRQQNMLVQQNIAVVQEHNQNQTYLQQLYEVQQRAEAYAALHHQQASLEVAAVQHETQRQFQHAELEMASQTR